MVFIKEDKVTNKFLRENKHYVAEAFPESIFCKAIIAE